MANYAETKGAVQTTTLTKKGSGPGDITFVLNQFARTRSRCPQAQSFFFHVVHMGEAFATSVDDEYVDNHDYDDDTDDDTW